MICSQVKLQLLPNHNFVIHVPSDIGRDFVSLFRGTCKQLPLADRRGILKFWKSSDCEWRPAFELSNQVGDQGYEIKFREESFRHLLKPAAQWVIAHELAHVQQKVVGRQALDYTEDENEEDADRIAKGWGFSKLWWETIDHRMDTYGEPLVDACDYFRNLLASDSFDVQGRRGEEKFRPKWDR